LEKLRKVESAVKSVVSGKLEFKLTVMMVPNRNGFSALSAAGLGDFAILTNLAQVLMQPICIQEVLGLKFGQDIDCVIFLSPSKQTIPI
jgi:hypothetical protein